MAADPIVQGLDLSQQFLASIDAYIKSQIENTFIDRIPGVDIIARTLDHELANTENVLSIAENSIKTQIEPLLKNAIPDAIAIVTNLAKSLDDNLSKLVNNIATTEDVLGSAINTLKGHAPQLAHWIYTEISGGLGATFLNVLKEIETQETAGIDRVLDELLGTKNVPPFVTELLTGFRKRGAEWQALAIPALAVGILLALVQAIEEPFKQVLEQDAYQQFPIKVADPGTIVDAGLRNFIDPERAKTEIRKTGYDAEPFSWLWEVRKRRIDPPELATLWFRKQINDADYYRETGRLGMPPEYAQMYRQAQERLLPEDYIRNAFLRAIIPAGDHDHRLEQYGYRADDAQLIRDLYFYIPPVADLIHMGIRNVFNAEIVKRFTLDGDYPQAFEDAGKAQGISPEWAHKYWQSHWIMPGREAFFEMFQRTVDEPLDGSADVITLSDGSRVHNIMGKETLALALRDIDTPPFYRDKLTQIAYRPLTRIDIRRLNKVGLLNHAGVQRAYLDLGYNLAHATLLADFTEKLNATTSKNAAQSLVSGLQRKVIELYVADKLPLEGVKQTLADLGFTDAEISVFVAEADLVHESEYITAVENGVGRLYSSGLITDKDAITRLTQAGVPVDAQTTLFAKWDLALEYRGGSDHILKHRDLTKGEVLESLSDGLLDQATTETMLEAMGYDTNSAAAEISLTLYKAARQSKRTQIDAIKASFVNGVIEQLDASNRLDALYVPSDQRDAYLTEWALARETRTERIPIATLRDMLKGQYLSEEQTLAHLKRHRFTDDDALLLVKFWQNQKAPKGLVSVSGT